MKVTYAIATSGDMSGTPHFRVVADELFDPHTTVQQIQDYPTTQPVIVVVHDQIADHKLLQTFCEQMRENFKCTLVLATEETLPSPIWYAFDRTIMLTSVREYTGVPAHEVHLFYTPGDHYPTVAPLGAQQTHIYVWAATDEFDKLLKWVRQAPFPMGIIRRAL